MAEIASFTRLYPFAAGPEHPATPERVRNVIASMNASRDSEAPFRVRLRYADGAVVTVCPKRSSTTKQKVAAHVG